MPYVQDASQIHTGPGVDPATDLALGFFEGLRGTYGRNQLAREAGARDQQRMQMAQEQAAIQEQFNRARLDLDQRRVGMVEEAQEREAGYRKQQQQAMIGSIAERLADFKRSEGFQDGVSNTGQGAMMPGLGFDMRYEDPEIVALQDRLQQAQVAMAEGGYSEGASEMLMNDLLREVSQRITAKARDRQMERVAAFSMPSMDGSPPRIPETMAEEISQRLMSGEVDPAEVADYLDQIQEATVRDRRIQYKAQQAIEAIEIKTQGRGFGALSESLQARWSKLDTSSDEGAYDAFLFHLENDTRTPADIERGAFEMMFARATEDGMTVTEEQMNEIKRTAQLYADMTSGAMTPGQAPVQGQQTGAYGPSPGGVYGPDPNAAAPNIAQGVLSVAQANPLDEDAISAALKKHYPNGGEPDELKLELVRLHTEAKSAKAAAEHEAELASRPSSQQRSSGRAGLGPAKNTKPMGLPDLPDDPTLQFIKDLVTGPKTPGGAKGKRDKQLIEQGMTKGGPEEVLKLFGFKVTPGGPSIEEWTRREAGKSTNGKLRRDFMRGLLSRLYFDKYRIPDQDTDRSFPEPPPR